jgi:hypothetical protein
MIGALASCAEFAASFRRTTELAIFRQSVRISAREGGSRREG